MAITLTVRVEGLAEGGSHELAVEVLTERMTARELIRSRVYQEVQDANLKRSSPVRSLVQPEEAERTLNGPRAANPRPIDWKPQYERAIEAFEAGQVLLLVDDRQVERLDEEFVVGSATVATFLRLKLLAGG